MRVLVIDKENENQRIDKFLLKYFGDMPKSFLYKMLRKKCIKINGGRICGSEILKAGDEIKIFMAESTIENFAITTSQSYKESKTNKKINLKIIYEDKDMIIVFKPSNMLVHGNGNGESTLQSEIIRYLEYKKDTSYLNSKNVNFMPAVCNRLDRNTEGLVIVAKNFSTAQKMNRLIQEHKIIKKYLAVCVGKPKKNKGILKGYWSKDNNNNIVKITDKKMHKDDKEVVTEYIVLASGKFTSLVEINLITGKSHQIRAQFAAINNPILGDKKYGSGEIDNKLKMLKKSSGQILCAYKLIIEGKEYKLECDYSNYVI